MCIAVSTRREEMGFGEYRPALVGSDGVVSCKGNGALADFGD